MKAEELNKLEGEFLERKRIRFNSEGKRINPQLRIQADNVDDEYIYLRSLISEEERIIFSFSDISCSTCLDNEVQLINQLIDDIGEEKLIFLADYVRPQDIYVFKRLNQIEVPVYNRLDNELGLSEELRGKIYVFVTDNTYKVRRFFIPHTKYPELSEAYYSSLKNIFKSE